MGRLGSRHRAVLAIVGVTALGAIAVLVAIDPFSGGPSARMLRPDDAQVVAQGQKVYAAQCAACHGQRLEGQPNWRQRGADGRLPAPPHDASGHTWHHPDDALFRITKYGVVKAADLKGYDSAMPAFEGRLSVDEILAALSWIKSQWPPEIRARLDRTDAQARP